MRRESQGGGNAEVSIKLVMPLSVTVIVPLALMSSMKLAAVTNCASRRLIRPKSAIVTTRDSG